MADLISSIAPRLPGKRIVISVFSGRHAFLGNDWVCDVAYNKRLFSTVDEALAATPGDVDAMREIVRSKFLRNTQLGMSLLATGNAEIITDDGANLLGNTLMDIRQAIRLERFYP